MNLLEIDGSFGEGGGQILRSAVSLACIMQKPIRIKNIRHNRKIPGLRAQHLATLQILANVCDAKTEGMNLGSTSITFTPGKMKDAVLSENVGTAGSITLVLQALIPVVSLSGKKLQLTITGGTDVPWSPTTAYTQHVLADAYSRIGIEFSMKTHKRGYYPKGGGLVDVVINPCKQIRPISFSRRVEKTAKIIGSFTSLDEQISNSLEKTKTLLEERQFATQMQYSQETAKNPGGSLLIFSSDSSSVVGADELLDIKNIDLLGTKSFLEFTKSNLGVDVNLSDMLVVPLSFCQETSTFTVKHISKHLETNLYITSKITGCKYGVGKIDGGYEVRIRGESNPGVK
jgi:RNA 3'-terminal phosphate cyclase (ATP)